MLRTILSLLALVYVIPLFASENQSSLVKVEKISIPFVYQFTGRIEAVHQATMKAQTSGQLAEIYFDVDDIVNKGDVLARFGNKRQKAELDLAKAGYAEAEADFLRSEEDFNRIDRLFAEKIVSKSDLDRALATQRAAKARLDGASARIKSASQEYEYTIIRAPYSGIVTKRHVQVGESVHPGSQLVSGISLDKLRVVVDVPQDLVETIRQHKKALLYLPDGSSVSSEDLTVFPFADEASHSFRVRISLPAGLSGLYPGVLVRVGFSGDDREVLVIPASALTHRGEMSIVYVGADDGRIALRQVRRGDAIDQGRLVVHAGLAEGESVYTDPTAATVLLKHSLEKAAQ
ncbi:MAG: efflux RND transporter periplasmic adaptor subunit [Gammaproteobacteria bacterium]|nr:efflux RND transporter periplasmic adaptor subunit [Gammaproteobacteria bacterium]